MKTMNILFVFQFTQCSVAGDTVKTDRGTEIYTETQ